MLDTTLKLQVLKLKADQLAELQIYVRGLMTTRSEAVRDAATVKSQDSWLVQTFETECQRLGLGFVPGPIRARVRLQTGNLAAFLDRAAPGAATIVRRAIIATGINLLVEDMLANGRIVNIRNVANNLDQLPGVLDRAFPGYSAAGWLGASVRQVRQGREKTDGK